MFRDIFTFTNIFSTSSSSYTGFPVEMKTIHFIRALIYRSPHLLGLHLGSDPIYTMQFTCFCDSSKPEQHTRVCFNDLKRNCFSVNVTLKIRKREEKGPTAFSTHFRISVCPETSKTPTFAWNKSPELRRNRKSLALRFSFLNILKKQ